MKSFILLSLLIFLGCTENQRVRNFGGTTNKNLPKGEKLVNITWKNDSMWILTRKMNENDVAETYSFKEESSFGLLEGNLVIIESK
jgi:hypothetical protein